MTQVYLNSDYGTSWNKLVIQDKWGNRFNNIDMSKVLTADELRIAQAVLDKVHDLEHPKAEQEISSSDGKQKVTELEEDDPYLIDNSVVTVDRYNYTIDFNRIAEIRFTREVEEYIGLKMK